MMAPNPEAVNGQGYIGLLCMVKLQVTFVNLSLWCLTKVCLSNPLIVGVIISATDE